AALAVAWLELDRMPWMIGMRDANDKPLAGRPAAGGKPPPPPPPPRRPPGGGGAPAPPPHSGCPVGARATPLVRRGLPTWLESRCHQRDSSVRQ
ncbi:hypothetical protein, partial [Nocardia brasiliensis]|uniref:hypothetical protein n=1 Tax=Nocardia brasiliensis TaxID=37326 RepID=UPI002454D900